MSQNCFVVNFQLFSYVVRTNLPILFYFFQNGIDFIYNRSTRARVVLRGVPKEIPVDEAKEDLLSQHPPVESVRRIQNRFREPLDLVLVSGTAEATKAAFFKIRSLCSLSCVKAEQLRKRGLPGQCHNCQSYGHSSRHCFNPARCVKCLGNHDTAQCTRNKDTDGPPVCVLCKQKGHTANYLGCPRATKRTPPAREGRAASSARARGLINTQLRPRSGRTAKRPPAEKQNPSAADDLNQLMSYPLLTPTKTRFSRKIPHRREPDGEINITLLNTRHT
ncbi:Nucleic-acid-binding protein from transposon X-element [Eumeta japonica]|uniref:Nucleic-acid-binding protein from transposon X-element n=1 Tax=Eumeta variegata TaxID=151549 RepID=A0A4C1XAR1_EUMVA|nr:Nucleic-acid-binding protein from transposon X-element [Eumeta japonica]